MDQLILRKLENLEQAIALMAAVMVTKDYFRNELGNYATKAEITELLQNQSEDIHNDLVNTFTALFNETDEKKADRPEVQVLERRVTKIERKINS